MSSIPHPPQHFTRTDYVNALKERDGNVRIGGTNITNLRFAGGVGALAKEWQELDSLVQGLDKTCTNCIMEISAEMDGLMTCNLRPFQQYFSHISMVGR